MSDTAHTNPTQADIDFAKQVLERAKAPAPTVTFKDVEVVNTGEGTVFSEQPTLEDLIAAARVQMSVPKKGKKVGQFEATDPQLINTLLAQASEQERIKKAAEAKRAEVVDFLADLLEAAGDGAEELLVDGAVVFTAKATESRVLDQTAIKALFPDIEDNAELWKTSVSVRRLIK